MSGAVGSMPSLTRGGRPSFSFRSSCPFGSTSTAWRVRSAAAIPPSLVSHLLRVLDPDRLEVVRRLEAEHLRQEREVRLQGPLDALGAAETVPFALEGDVGVRDTAPRERFDDDLRLRRRDDLVLESPQKQ